MIVICPTCVGKGNGCRSCGHAGTLKVSPAEHRVRRELARLRALYVGEQRR